MEILFMLGIPTAMVSCIFGIFSWWLKRHLEKRDAKSDERIKNIETLMLMIMQDGRATNVLATATAKAVQRIPDAHCNGDMDGALQEAAKIQNEQKQFLIDQGIKHIFED